MQYVDEEAIALSAFEALRDVDVVGIICSAQGECKLPPCAPQSTLYRLLGQVVSYQESQEIERKRRSGKKVFTPDNKFTNASKEITIPRGKRVRMGPKAVRLFQDFVNDYNNGKEKQK